MVGGGQGNVVACGGELEAFCGEVGVEGGVDRAGVWSVDVLTRVSVCADTTAVRWAAAWGAHDVRCAVSLAYSSCVRWGNGVLVVVRCWGAGMMWTGIVEAPSRRDDIVTKLVRVKA